MADFFCLWADRHPLFSADGALGISCMSFLDHIEPLKQTATSEMRGAHDLPALDQTRTNYLGVNGKFTALLKQLGALPREERPAAGKLINAAKAELEAV